MKHGAAVVLVVVSIPATAWAQVDSSATPPRRERLFLSLGAGMIGGQALGDRRASFTENRAPSGGRLTYFDAQVELEGAPLLGARLAFRAVDGLWLEGSVARSGRRLSTSVSNDFEGAPPRVIQSDISELQIEGGLRWDVGALSFLSERGVPFLFAGAGYLRQGPRGGPSSLDLTGRTYVAGAGVVYRLVSRARGWLKGAGLRLDAGLSWRTGGFEMEDRRRSAARATLSLYSSH